MCVCLKSYDAAERAFMIYLGSRARAHMVLRPITSERTKLASKVELSACTWRWLRTFNCNSIGEPKRDKRIRWS